MRICFVIGRYPPVFGGAGISVEALAKELVRKGHLVMVMTFGEQREKLLVEESPMKARVYRVGFWPKKRPTGWLLALRGAITLWKHSKESRRVNS